MKSIQNEIARVTKTRCMHKYTKASCWHLHKTNQDNPKNILSQKKESNAENRWRNESKIIPQWQKDNFCLAHCVNASTTRTHDGTTFQRLKLLHNITALASNGKPREMTRQKQRKRLFGKKLFFIPKIATFFGRLSRHHADDEADSESGGSSTSW